MRGVTNTVRAADGARLAWRLFGGLDPATSPVVLVHGWMASGKIWDALIAHLPGIALIVPDLRGAGASEGTAGSLSLDRWAEDIATVLADAGAESVDLVGHSMGGQIAQLVALRQPDRVRSLALLNPVPMRGLSLPAEADALFRSAGGDRDKLGQILDLACRCLDPRARGALIADALTIDPEIIAQGQRAWTIGSDAPVESIDVDTLVVATSDPFLPMELLQKAVVDRIPRARLAALPGPGHYPLVEAAPATAMLLRELFAGASSAQLERAS